MKKQDQYIVVIGLGKTGYSVVSFFADRGKNVIVMDTREEPPFYQAVTDNYEHVSLILGGLNEEVLSGAQKIVIRPGVTMATKEIQAAIKNGVPVVGDIQIFAEYAKAPIVAITGSNAKSTVTTLLGDMAKDAGLNVAIGGNLGTPALELINENVQLYVMELSSFQLETTPNLKADVATVLNVSPDHLDRYESYDEYWHAKHNIFNGCKAIVVNRDDKRSMPMMDLNVKTLTFGLDEAMDKSFCIVKHDGDNFLALDHHALINCKQLKIKGTHNRSNALAALALGSAAGLSLDSMLTTLQDYPGLEHRCQWVGKHGGVDYFNDSKGTNVGATVAAIDGLKDDIDGSIILMAGGDGKGADFGFMRQAIHASVKTLVAYGRDKQALFDALCADTKVILANDFDDAFQQARLSSVAGDAVLLSPACASFDMFNSFEHRGEAFVELVEAL
jgi:UDP-N-acetylmuramoylalanine--D-glutamate ligase